MKAFGCIGFDFSITDDGELKSNFTFKYPAKMGFVYHVSSYSPVNMIFPAIWDSKHRGGNTFSNIWLQSLLSVYQVSPTNNTIIHFVTEELTSLILDTDYNQWAVLAQCKRSSNALSSSFLSTRYDINSIL